MKIYTHLTKNQIKVLTNLCTTYHRFPTPNSRNDLLSLANHYLEEQKQPRCLTPHHILSLISYIDSYNQQHIKQKPL
jgi:hypothetical protein